MMHLIKQFLDDLQVRNYSGRTIADYGYHLELWLRFMQERKIEEPSRISESVLAEFQRWLYCQPTRRGTVRGVLNQNTVLAALKSFFRFLKAEGLLRITPGKGGRDRIVPLGTMAVVALRTYLSRGRPELLRSSATDHLLLSYRGNPIDPHTLGALVKQHARAAGIRKSVTPHVWRHTCATHLIQNHASLRHVQDLLGHQSLTTTERYQRLTITDLKEAHTKFHPREQSFAAVDSPPKT